MSGLRLNFTFGEAALILRDPETTSGLAEEIFEQGLFESRIVSKSPAVRRTRVFREVLCLESLDRPAAAAQALKALIDLGVDVDAFYVIDRPVGLRTIQTLLHAAIATGGAALVGQLLSAGADPRRRRTVQVTRPLSLKGRLADYSPDELRTEIASVRMSVQIKNCSREGDAIEGADGALTALFEREHFDAFELADSLFDSSRKAEMLDILHSHVLRSRVEGLIDAAGLAAHR